jgi:branched-chain amino acid transport system substrate-binding protein
MHARAVPGRRAAAAIAVTALGAAACSGGGGSATPTVPSTDSPVATVVPRTNVDGHFRLGVWLPESGSAAILGTPLLAGVELAVREINESGGVNGQLLEVITRDEGSDPETAFEALRDLLQADQVDVIVGPASARVALGALDVLADAKALTCSPTTSAVELEQRTDDGYFVRTIGSEALEAVALAQAMIDTGDTTFALLYPNDDYGLAFADRVRRAFTRWREDVRPVSYEPTATQFNAPIQTALAGGTEVVGVVGSGQTGAHVLAGLAANGATPGEVPTFVTDGLRRDDLGGLIDPRRPMASAGIKGVAPLAEPRNSTFAEAFARSAPGTPITYAAYAYDCVNLLAVAAQAARTDDPSAIKAQLAAVSSGGSPCQTFKGCADALAEGRNINLDGASGELTLLDNGDIGVAAYDVFEYDASGQDRVDGTITVRADTG